MHRKVPSVLFAILIIFFIGGRANAVPTFVIDFETLLDYDNITNQYASQHVTFADAFALTAGYSLNEFDFPPHSGQNVAFSEESIMHIYFDAPVNEWQAYFTYAAPVTINALDESGVVIASLVSSLSENYVSSGNAPNELLSFELGSNLNRTFSSLEIIGGDPYGGSFVMDDMGYNVVPEPGTLLLLGTGIAGLGLAYKRKRRA
jgi:hypothetical protein